jgi:hypothetical protein
MSEIENPSRVHNLNIPVQEEADVLRVVECVVPMEYRYTAELIELRAESVAALASIDVKKIIFDGKIVTGWVREDALYASLRLKEPRKVRTVQIELRFAQSMRLLINIVGTRVDIPLIHIRKDTSHIVSKRKIKVKSCGPVCDAEMRPIDSLTDVGLESNCMPCRGVGMIGELGQRGCAPHAMPTWEPGEPLKDAQGRIYERDKG